MPWKCWFVCHIEVLAVVKQILAMEQGFLWLFRTSTLKRHDIFSAFLISHERFEFFFFFHAFVSSSPVCIYIFLILILQPVIHLWFDFSHEEIAVQ